VVSKLNPFFIEVSVLDRLPPRTPFRVLCHILTIQMKTVTRVKRAIAGLHD
jgi:hypothetical protein